MTSTFKHMYVLLATLSAERKFSYISENISQLHNLNCIA